MMDTIEPEWNHVEQLDYVVGDDIEFTVFDNDVTGHEVLGRASLSASAFYPAGFNGSLELTETGLESGAAILFVEVELPMLAECQAWPPTLEGMTEHLMRTKSRLVDAERRAEAAEARSWQGEANVPFAGEELARKSRQAETSKKPKRKEAALRKELSTSAILGETSPATHAPVGSEQWEKGHLLTEQDEEETEQYEEEAEPSGVTESREAHPTTSKEAAEIATVSPSGQKTKMSMKQKMKLNQTQVSPSGKKTKSQEHDRHMQQLKAKMKVVPKMMNVKQGPGVYSDSDSDDDDEEYLDDQVKVDPEDQQPYLFEELLEKYEDSYTRREVKKYWKHSCIAHDEFSTGGPSKANLQGMRTVYTRDFLDDSVSPDQFMRQK